MAEVISRVRAGRMSEWCRFLVEASAAGESVLEIASGTGEMSLVLASLGRSVTLLDFSLDSLRFSQSCAEALGLVIRTVQADILHGAPFVDGEFDCCWSSGLLEHFPLETRRAILKEKARVSRERVISLVPNAACLAYRIGKVDQERRGIWPYGLETPIETQRDDFAAAGLEVRQEQSVGAKHAVNFLQSQKPLFRELRRWVAEQSEHELLSCRQGYLLATVGIKSAGGPL
jgi:SAM-dependent methyltransferase